MDRLPLPLDWLFYFLQQMVRDADVRAAEILHMELMAERYVDGHIPLKGIKFIL